MNGVEFAINLKDNFSQTLKKVDENFKNMEKEKKRKQIKFAKNIIIIFYMATFCINVNSIFFSHTQDSKFFLIYNSVSLGINIAFIFLNLFPKIKKYI